MAWELVKTPCEQVPHPASLARPVSFVFRLSKQFLFLLNRLHSHNKPTQGKTHHLPSGSIGGIALILGFPLLLEFLNPLYGSSFIS